VPSGRGGSSPPSDTANRPTYLRLLQRHNLWSALGPCQGCQGVQLVGEQVPVGVQGDAGRGVVELLLHRLDARPWPIISQAALRQAAFYIDS
jgi:hypothetical protein